ncbi:hypothetical protein L6E12_03225 [Actinokineospora sp. PR83]|uniref:hypothetical protein n=1 Tax=Actinokineospora sp. PR83 TaxID=2884908 RepID=UPI001F3C095E|nr:hypothetical protein [Actinokineospora sp. PR83]MCG8914808.1 hypothetical protein [Actinokineospora sp. PR83]
MYWAIDRVLPHWDQRERHERWINASPGAVWAALDELRAADLPLTAFLTRLRGGPRAWLKPMPELDRVRVLQGMAPRTMHADPPRELLMGDIARYASMKPTRPDITRGDLCAFRRFAEPGWTKVAMNFTLCGQSGGTLLKTETRVTATDDTARRAFRRYWLLVRAGSGVIRRDILRGVDTRAGLARTEKG